MKVGQDIDGKAANDRSGSSVSLSSDGLRVAIGAQGTINFSKKGYISIYQYNSGSSSWVQLGSDISGDSANDQFGHSISLSSDGLRVASGGYFRSDAIAGYARVYQYNTGTSSWTQLGSDLVGEANGDRFSQNLSLSSDGSILAVGAPLHTVAGAFNGYGGQVSVYKYNSGTVTWTQLGGDIEDNSHVHLGRKVALSSDGSRLLISDPHYQLGYGDNDDDNNDGRADRLDHNGKGSVGLYLIPVGDSYQYAWDVDNGNNTAPSDGTYTATVLGTDLAGNAYSGSDSITFT